MTLEYFLLQVKFLPSRLRALETFDFRQFLVFIVFSTANNGAGDGEYKYCGRKKLNMFLPLTFVRLISSSRHQGWRRREESGEVPRICSSSSSCQWCHSTSYRDQHQKIITNLRAEPVRSRGRSSCSSVWSSEHHLTRTRTDGMRSYKSQQSFTSGMSKFWH